MRKAIVISEPNSARKIKGLRVEVNALNWTISS